MADQIMTAASNHSAIIPEVWSASFYDVLLADFAFSPVISKQYQGEIANLGDTVNISSFPEFDDGTELAEDAANDAEAISVSGQALVINKRVVKDFIVTSLAIAQSLSSMDKLKELAIYSIMKKMEKTIIATISPSTSSPDHVIAYTSGTTLALADILASKELLDTANVPQSDRHMALGSAQLNDLFNITGFMSSDFVTAGSPLSSGQIPGSLLGFAPHFSTLVSSTSYYFHSSFMTMAVQQGMSVAQYDLGAAGKRALRVNCDVLWGLKQLDSKRVVSIA